MSDNIRELRPAKPDVPDVAGYVEAVTDTAVLGWTWQPGQRTRLSVELRMGGEVVSRAVADLPREDLARSGIGDGEHAFSLAIPEELRSRAKELRVLACLPDGRLVPLDAPPANEIVPDGLARLQRGVDALIGSHRLMHRNLQTALTQQGPNLVATMAEITEAQGKLDESITTLERFVVRIEAAMHAHEAPAAPATHGSRAAWFALAGSALALIGSSAALLRVLFGA